MSNKPWLRHRDDKGYWPGIPIISSLAVLIIFLALIFALGKNINTHTPAISASASAPVYEQQNEVLVIVNNTQAVKFDFKCYNEIDHGIGMAINKTFTLPILESAVEKTKILNDYNTIYRVRYWQTMLVHPNNLGKYTGLIDYSSEEYPVNIYCIGYTNNKINADMYDEGYKETMTLHPMHLTNIYIRCHFEPPIIREKEYCQFYIDGNFGLDPYIQEKYESNLFTLILSG
jgi:hypothetical protein